MVSRPIPEEIISMILSYVMASAALEPRVQKKDKRIINGHHPGPGTHIVVFARVNAVWRGEVERLLYDHILLWRPRQIIACFKTIAYSRRGVGRYVKALQICLPDYDTSYPYRNVARVHLGFPTGRSRSGDDGRLLIAFGRVVHDALMGMKQLTKYSLSIGIPRPFVHRRQGSEIRENKFLEPFIPVNAPFRLQSLLLRGPCISAPLVRFLRTQSSIVELDAPSLSSKYRLNAPAVLPNLRRIHGPVALLRRNVPDRPIESVQCSGSIPDSSFFELVDRLQHSSVPLKKFSIPTVYVTSARDYLPILAQKLPRLESLRLSDFAPFASTVDTNPYDLYKDDSFLHALERLKDLREITLYAKPMRPEETHHFGFPGGPMEDGIMGDEGPTDAEAEVLEHLGLAGDAMIIDVVDNIDGVPGFEQHIGPPPPNPFVNGLLNNPPPAPPHPPPAPPAWAQWTFVNGVLQNPPPPPPAPADIVNVPNPPPPPAANPNPPAAVPQGLWNQITGLLGLGGGNANQPPPPPANAPPLPPVAAQTQNAVPPPAANPGPALPNLNANGAAHQPGGPHNAINVTLNIGPGLNAPLPPAIMNLIQNVMPPFGGAGGPAPQAQPAPPPIPRKPPVIDEDMIYEEDPPNTGGGVGGMGMGFGDGFMPMFGDLPGDLGGAGMMMFDGPQQLNAPGPGAPGGNPGAAAAAGPAPNPFAGFGGNVFGQIHLDIQIGPNGIPIPVNLNPNPNPNPLLNPGAAPPPVAPLAQPPMPPPVPPANAIPFGPVLPPGFPGAAAPGGQIPLGVQHHIFVMGGPMGMAPGVPQPTGGPPPPNAPQPPLQAGAQPAGLHPPFPFAIPGLFGGLPQAQPPQAPVPVPGPVPMPAAAPQLIPPQFLPQHGPFPMPAAGHGPPLGLPGPAGAQASNRWMRNFEREQRHRLDTFQRSLAAEEMTVLELWNAYCPTLRKVTFEMDFGRFVTWRKNVAGPGTGRQSVEGMDHDEVGMGGVWWPSYAPTARMKNGKGKARAKKTDANTSASVAATPLNAPVSSEASTSTSTNTDVEVPTPSSMPPILTNRSGSTPTSSASVSTTTVSTPLPSTGNSTPTLPPN